MSLNGACMSNSVTWQEDTLAGGDREVQDTTYIFAGAFPFAAAVVFALELMGFSNFCPAPPFLHLWAQPRALQHFSTGAGDVEFRDIVIIGQSWH